MIHFLSEHWLTILGASAVAWSLFALGREYEYDHPRGGFSFTPDESWSEPKIEWYDRPLHIDVLPNHTVSPEDAPELGGLPPVPTRRGIYDVEQER